jgi:Holliday junction DNA helicase RuvA
MIAGLSGKLEARGTDYAIVNVGGVSFQVHVPTSTLTSLGAIGEEVYLHTHLYIREDNMALYGFASPEELELFQMLITVSGVGPRMALALLSAMNPERLAQAIASGNADLLTEIPGIGKRMANRLVVELKGKLEGWAGAVAAAPVQASNAEVVAALRSLGYSASEAASAVASLPDDPDLSTEDKIRLALQHFARG